MARLQESPAVERGWITPEWVIKFLEDRYGPFDLDPCATELSAKANRWYGPGSEYGIDGLSSDWDADNVFMNPPYGKGLGRWVSRAYEAVRSGEVRGWMVCLLPARPDTQWFVPAFRAREWLIFTGRIFFIHPETMREHTQPLFPNMVVSFYKGTRNFRGTRKPSVTQVVTRAVRAEYEGGLA